VNTSEEGQESQVNKQSVFDVIIILSVAQVSSAFSGNSFAFCLGQTLALGIFGFGLYVFLDTYIFKKNLRANQTGLRQYSIGIVLISGITIPFSVAKAAEQSKAAEFQVGKALGEIATLCEFSGFLRSNYCPALNIPPRLPGLCQAGVATIAPAHMRNETVSTINSKDFKEAADKIRQQARTNITIAQKQPGYTQAALCNGYSELF
jgi:hypothetical protein